MNEMSKPQAVIKGEDHWTTKDGGVKLFMFEKCAGDPAKTIGTILFVHGSSMAGQPTFDLQVPGRPDSSVMDFFARQNYDCWCVDMEGYGRSTKDRDNNAPIAYGAIADHSSRTIGVLAAALTAAAIIPMVLALGPFLPEVQAERARPMTAGNQISSR